ncbi:hypothetical protein GFM02_24405 [Rhizobium leguminosarum bv. viciae]|nr:hypothetical protein [Rhizobium leguminosarum bv. viciae]
MSCRTRGRATGLDPSFGPPQGGRSAGRNVSTFMNALRKRSLVWGSPNHLPISPLVGEMPGRAEGGATPSLRPGAAA